MRVVPRPVLRLARLSFQIAPHSLEAGLLVRTVATEIRLEVVCSGGRSTSIRQRPVVRPKYEGYTCGAHEK